MEVDDLKLAWAELDKRVATTQALAVSLLRDNRMSKMRGSLRGLVLVIAFELIMSWFAMIWLARFLIGQPESWLLMTSTIILAGASVVVIVASIWQLAIIGRLDYSSPVVKIQHDIASLRTARLQVTRWILLLSPLLWLPGLIVTAQGVIGFDIWKHFGPRWVISNFVLGLVCVPVAIVASRRIVSRHGSSWIVKRIADELAGISLRNARQQLEEIAQFEEMI
jgi:hypothetical protein